ncbi:MAG: glutathione S-transferase family protein [Methylobacteriaceae bacterium]|nr:glutathione S-transferase family protein [Methylobacteriaceae bacterium]
MAAATLYAHPFSSYCQKTIIALRERGYAFELRMVDFGDAASVGEFAALWPIRRMPALVEDGRMLVESSIIIEHVDLARPGARLIPADPRAALETRLLDRIFDNYVMTPVQKIVVDRIRAPDRRDAQGVAEAHALLATTYRWLEARLGGRTWAAGAAFSLADCAAAPSLFYADWVDPIDPALTGLCAYRARLLAHPTIARVIDEARPYRHLFPGGAPDRD